MNQEKISKFIKEIRMKHSLTQAEFAKQYNVTYQAVSKWENGKNIPDIALLNQICKDYNMDINELLDAKRKNKHNWHKYIFLGLGLIFVLLILIIYLKKDDFYFKTISSGCDNFTISGSLSYNEQKSSIYISNVNYCGENKNLEYKTINCSLYEKNNDKEILISTSNYQDTNKITLEKFLNNVEFTVNNYNRTCKDYSDETLYLKIEASNNKNEIITYKIPLTLKDC